MVDCLRRGFGPPGQPRDPNMPGVYEGLNNKNRVLGRRGRKPVDEERNEGRHMHPQRMCIYTCKEGLYNLLQIDCIVFLGPGAQSLHREVFLV